MPTVLIIDDEAMIRSLLRRVFQRAGLEVMKAGDGGEGLEKFAAKPADLVIRDLIMPKVDGMEVITRIRRTAPATKIIAMSGGGTRPNSERNPDRSSGTTNGSGEDGSRYYSPYKSRERVKGVYRPTWDVERQVITTYSYTPVRVYPDGSSVEGPVALDAVADPDELFEIDMRALTEAVETLDELYRNKFRLIVSIPICFETLSSKKQRMEYLAKCRFTPAHIRCFIQFEFPRFPLGVPNGRMTDLVTEMRPFRQGIFVRADFRGPLPPLVREGIGGRNAGLRRNRLVRRTLIASKRFEV